MFLSAKIQPETRLVKLYKFATYTCPKPIWNLANILTANKQYKRVTTWTDLTKVNKNDKSTQTTKSTIKLTMTECHRTNAESDRKTDMLLSSQLLDYDEGPTEDRPGQTPNKRVADSEGLSYESESMRMIQLLGHLCTN